MTASTKTNEHSQDFFGRIKIGLIDLRGAMSLCQTDAVADHAKRTMMLILGWWAGQDSGVAAGHDSYRDQLARLLLAVCIDALLTTLSHDDPRRELIVVIKTETEQVHRL